MKELLLPDLGDGITEGTITKILVEVNNPIEEGESVFEMETGKATVEVPASESGVVKKILVSEGDVVSVGAKILLVESAHETAKNEINENVAPEKKEERSVNNESVVNSAEQTGSISSEQHLIPATPNVRKLARENNVDIGAVNGSGEYGRVLISDIETAVFNKELPAKVAEPEIVVKKQESAVLISSNGNVTVEPMSMIRRKTAEKMMESVTNIPHVTNHDLFDIDMLNKFREKINNKLQSKISATVYLLKVIAMGLKKCPKFNASLNMQKFEIIYKNDINIGVAVDSPKGLLVPVIKNVNNLGVQDISNELKRLVNSVVDGKPAVSDLTGGTFSVSNLGSIGGHFFTPIINYPEVAIIGFGRSYKVVDVNSNGEVITKEVLPVSLSYDHRLIDGADAARFLAFLKSVVEYPEIFGWL